MSSTASRIQSSEGRSRKPSVDVEEKKQIMSSTASRIQSSEGGGVAIIGGGVPADLFHSSLLGMPVTASHFSQPLYPAPAIPHPPLPAAPSLIYQPPPLVQVPPQQRIEVLCNDDIIGSVVGSNKRHFNEISTITGAQLRVQKTNDANVHKIFAIGTETQATSASTMIELRKFVARGRRAVRQMVIWNRFLQGNCPYGERCEYSHG